MTCADFLGGPEKGRLGCCLECHQFFDQVGEHPKDGVIYRSPRIRLAN